jgi:predicted dehydrogenase
MEAVMAFASGAIGSIGLSDTYENGFSKMEMFEVFGQDFYLSYNMQRLRYQEGKGEWVEHPTPKDVNLLLEENKRFLAAAERNDPAGVLSSYDDALKTLEVTLAMNESAKTGKVIST